MTEGEFFDVMRAAIWSSAIASLPILAVALAVGLFIGLFQALTSIQEMTLTFVPKLAAIALTFWISMDFMTQTLVSLFHSTLLPMIAGG